MKEEAGGSSLQRLHFQKKNAALTNCGHVVSRFVKAVSPHKAVSLHFFYIRRSSVQSKPTSASSFVLQSQLVCFQE